MIRLSDMLNQIVHAAVAHATPHELPKDWDSEAWTTFHALAQYHGVTPLIAYAIQNGALRNMPDSAAARFQKDLHQNRLFHHAALERLADLEQALTAADIPAVPLKGPRLGDRVYPGVGLRPFEDLDILIDPENRTRAHEILAGKGYRPISGERMLGLLPAFHFHSQWVDPRSRQCVELHWRPADRGSLPPAGLKDSHYRERIATESEAYAVYLAVHLDKHGICSGAMREAGTPPLAAVHPWNDTRLVWILDLHFLRNREGFDEDAMLRIAKEWRVSDAVENARYLTRLFTGGGDTADATLRSPRWQQKVMKRIVHELDGPAGVPDTPWWLKPGKRTGFRPVRFLDILSSRS